MSAERKTLLGSLSDGDRRTSSDPAMTLERSEEADPNGEGTQTRTRGEAVDLTDRIETKKRGESVE